MKTQGQQGFALALAMFCLVVAASFGLVAWQKVHTDATETGHDVKNAKSRFAAEAAAYMGLQIVNQPGATAPTCVTHDAAGKTAASGAGSCASADLSKFDRVYAKGGLSLGSNGWLVSQPSDTAESLSGSRDEKLEIKIWQPTSATVRVVGRATVNGVVSDVQLFGQWDP